MSTQSPTPVTPASALSELPQRVGEKTNRALAAGDALFFESSRTFQQCDGVDYQIRICPALLLKPTAPPPGVSVSDKRTDGSESPSPSQAGEVAQKKKEKKDVFAPPYVPNLHVLDVKADGGEEYVILLNKYMVVRNHFMLATKDFVPQTSPLFPADLLLARRILEAYKAQGTDLLCFFNCGEKSGASQPHKHIQFLPLDAEGCPIEKLAQSVHVDREDKPFSLSSLPYAHFLSRLRSLPRASSHPDALAAELGNRFMSLLDAQVDTYRRLPDAPRPPWSYNVLMTWDHLYLFPRSHESFTIAPEAGEGWQMPVNSLGYAGMLLVRREAELKGIETAGGVCAILSYIGFPKVEIPEESTLDNGFLAQ